MARTPTARILLCMACTAAAFGQVTISLGSEARVGMPVWLRVKLPNEQQPSLRYPFMIFPASFGCYQIEVRRDGKPLPRIADMASQAFGGITLSGSPCGSVAPPSEPHFKGRIPLHLQYRFDRPGIYEVRLTERNAVPQEASASTDWTRIDVLPAETDDRRRWLLDLNSQPSTDAADLLTDFLPDILGVPDEQSLAMLAGYLYHPDRLVRDYAMYGLTYWPEQQAAAWVWDALRANGPSDETVMFLLHVKQFAADHAGPMVEASIRFLQSDLPVVSHGALTAIQRIALAEDSQVNAALRTRAEQALVAAADHFTQADPQTVNDYVSALGQVRDEHAHDLLWQLVNRHAGFEQALIALTWRKSPADLPKLAELALEPADGRTEDRELASLPYALHNAYGDAAIPYLERMRDQSTYPQVRIAAARELMPAVSSSGSNASPDR